MSRTRGRAVRTAAVYLLTVAVPAAVALVVLRASAGGSTGTSTHPAPAAGTPLYTLLLAVAVVVGSAAAGGVVARRCGQPRVIGELVAGLMLGPSVLGALLPGVEHSLFPAQILPQLDLLAQLGVILFMFLVGCELSSANIRSYGTRAVLIGHAAIALPFLAGVALTWVLAARYRPAGVAMLPYLLFGGVALAITALPVLARILGETGLLHTPLGVTGLAAAGVGDVTAWCLLAAVVAIVRGTSLGATAWVVAGVMLFAVVMVGLVRPFVARLARRSAGQARPPLALSAAVICLVLVAAFTTERLGVHAVFGAFAAGAVLPADHPAIRELTAWIEGATAWLLLPLFFVAVGLHTRLGTLTGTAAWLACAGTVAVAVASKVLGAGGAALATGYGLRDSLGLGVMMNCRGLTELVVLNIGLTLGVLSPALFTILVVMALVTTMVTGPLLRRTVREAGPARPAG